jgi:hypothetical protein
MYGWQASLSGAHAAGWFVRFAGNVGAVAVELGSVAISVPAAPANAAAVASQPVIRDIAHGPPAMFVAGFSLT